MQQIDLGPNEYRAPQGREPFFVPGGLSKLGMFFFWIGFYLAIQLVMVMAFYAVKQFLTGSL